MNKIETTLAERAKTHGEFSSHARIAQSIKNALRGGAGWACCNNAQREALEMLAHKMARIANGDPNHHDHWHDLIGYAQLVARELQP